MGIRLFFQGSIALFFTIVVFLIALCLCAKEGFPMDFESLQKVNFSPFENYYALNIRGNLFAGLLSVGGFLMTGKTFILVTMKQNVFDDDSYIENFKKLSKHNSTLTQYGPLVQLKNALYIAVFLTIISAVVQLSIGLIPHWSAALISIFFAIFSIILVIDSLNLIKKNLDFWING